MIQVYRIKNEFSLLRYAYRHLEVPTIISGSVITIKFASRWAFTRTSAPHPGLTVCWPTWARGTRSSPCTLHDHDHPRVVARCTVRRYGLPAAQYTGGSRMSSPGHARTCSCDAVRACA
eukprot:4128451-Prymnesium_polylepis.2